ncbi:MAG: murein biosynthesis integral membrane protein MurJ [Candidatus Moranbacteria bacterium]|nr:murein biosynthesis integral membrane protein MurJ [Candidatus Moranbacteria bacterium]
MIRKFINNKILNGKPTESVTAAAFIIAAAGIASRLLGLFRDRILAAQFGAGDTLDVYYAAFRIPDLVYNLLVLGALSAAFIPVFTSLHSTEKEDDAWKLASGMLNLQTIAVFLISGTFALLAPWILHLITPGFSDEKMATTAVFSRVMFLSPVLLGISAIFGGVLVSFRKFLIYSLAPIFYNIGIVTGALVFVPMMGPVGLAWGVVLGAGLHMLIQYPAVKFSGFRYLPMSFSLLADYHVRKVIRLMIPRALGIAVNQVNLLVITIFASTLAAGSLTVFTFANNIQATPIGLFGSSFAIAVFPLLSTYAAKNLNDDFVNRFSRTLKQILFFIIPLSIILIILRAQIVRVILGSGKFDWEDTVLTFQTLGLLAASLFAQALVPLLTRSFYSLHNTKTPFYIALVSEAVNIILVILLIRQYAVFGLAIAFSAASIVNMTLLLTFLRKHVGSLKGKSILFPAIKILIASGIAGIVIQLTKYAMDYLVNIDTFIGIFSQLVVAGIVGGLTFIAMCVLLNVEEFYHFKNSLTERLFRTRERITESTSEVGGI